MLKALLLTSVFAFLFHDLSAQSPSVLDVVVIGRDTIVASTHDMKIIVTYNGGKTWTTTKKELMKQLGTDGKRIWGIDSWIGIHENDYSRIFYSDDYGKTWKQFELDTRKFFAMNFLHLNRKLYIVDALGGLWEHRVSTAESANNWKKITSHQFRYPGDGPYAATEEKYALLTRDSLYLREFGTGRTTTKQAFDHRMRTFCFVDNNNLLAVDGDRNLFKYSILKNTYQKIDTIQGYRYINELLYRNGKLYILGSGNDAVKDYVLFSVWKNESTNNEFIAGITGLDQDICYVDTYSRIWCGTTEGLFVLEPNAKRFKKIL